MKYGFIGCGNMGGALARALARRTKDFTITDRSGKAIGLAAELACGYSSAEEIAAGCERIFLGVKPQMMAGVLERLRPQLAEQKPVLITMAAGLSMAQIDAMAGGGFPIIRIMPNTPAAVGKGLVLYCANELVSGEVLESFLKDMGFAGRFDRIEERLFDAAGTVTGCGPAYVYMFIEAMADGAVACGVPRVQAMEYAASTLAGAAEMVLQSGIHPGALKDAVCSPGGSTIAGVRALEDHAFRGTVMDCIMAAYQRNQELGK
ncbi:MAG: pyrroline-5-carboxylate reductase [Oscillospiraceae bacterium]|nr:pyrroline-5-carboxylate reductase [Oscillospiraceae bacterium]